MQKLYEKFKDELLNSCVPFWLNHGWDKEYGGLLNCLDRTGKVYSLDKNVWMQGRAGWMYSYIYNNIEKNQEYLDFAKSCIDFASKYCIDQADGRMYFSVTRDGKPIYKRAFWFSETFFVMANAEYYMATGEGRYLEQAKKYFDFVYGIYLDAASDPYQPTPRIVQSTRNVKTFANPMILLNVASIMRDADGGRLDYNKIIDGLIADIKCFYKPEYRATFENINAEDGSVLMDSSLCRVINPGHDIECAWFLLDEGIKRQDQQIKSFAETMFNDAFDLGWDKEYGGIIYFKDILGTPVEAYEHDMKLWWPQNETIIASLMLYKETGEERYKQILEKVCDYAFKHFSDREYGEWYGYLRRDGKPTEPACKGHTYKGPFHVMRMLAKCICLLKDETDK